MCSIALSDRLLQIKVSFSTSVSNVSRSIHDKLLVGATVEPLYNRHHWEPTVCPL